MAKVGDCRGICAVVDYLPIALNVKEFTFKFLHFIIFYGILSLEEYRGAHLQA